MKKLLFMMMGAMIAFASCQKDVGLDGVVGHEEVSVTISAGVDDGSVMSRASGDGESVDRCLLEVYLDGKLYKRMVTAVSGRAASFELTLVSSQEYEFLLWADKAKFSVGDSEVVSSVGTDITIGEGYDNHYVTNTALGLKAITANYSSYDGNDETRDAFYFYSKQALPESGVIDAALTRPFAQVNVKTYLDGVDSSQYPTEAQVFYSTKIATIFDMSADTASGADISTEETWVWSGAATYVSSGSSESPAYYDLSTDYLFAPANAQMLVDFSMDITLGNGTIVKNDGFKNIPIQRNYQTNISGELLTKKGSINVSISDYFNSTTNDVVVKTVANASELNTELSTDADVQSTSYIVEGEVATGTTITIPATTATNATRSITLNEVANDAAITIEDGYSTTDQSVSEIYITIPAGSTGVTISVNMPRSTVYINGTEVANLSTWASANTTIIGADSKITGTLTVNQGNVEIYGSVNNVEFANGNDDSVIKVWTVYTDSELKNALALGSKVTKIVLGADLALTEGVTLTSATTIDGAGNSMTFSNSGASVSCSADLTLENITISNTGNGYALYVPDNSSATEINISGSTLSGYAALYTHGDNATYNITDSTLSGTNNVTSSLEHFATICVETDATGNTFNIQNTAINTVTTGIGYNFAIDVREATGSTTVNLTQGTKFHYDSNGHNGESRYYFIEHKVNFDNRSTFTRDNSITYSSDKENMSLASGLLFGKGTEASPYEIYDSFDLQLLKYYTYGEYDYPTFSYVGTTFAHFKQMCDIDFVFTKTILTPYPSPFVTISNNSASASTSPTSNMLADHFYGVYDGNGFSIHNFGYNEAVTGADDWGDNSVIGLFANVYYGSTIKNLTLTCDDNFDGILTTDACSQQPVAVGAFAGNFSGVIENCVNNIPITIYSTDATFCRVGGIFGKPLYGVTDGYIDFAEAIGCTNNADINLTNQGSAGGILGGGTNPYWKAGVAIMNCTVNGDVTAPYAYEFNVNPTGDSGDTYYFFDDGGNVCTGKVTSTATVE